MLLAGWQEEHLTFHNNCQDFTTLVTGQEAVTPEKKAI